MILQGDAAEVLKDFNDNCIDLTVTSPPYDNLRTYGGYTFNFEAIAKELYRVTKQDGVLVWITNDQTIDGDESGNSFRQALYFKDIGFKLHDTMIYGKAGISNPHPNIYHQCFEYMFVFCKGLIQTFNPIEDRMNQRRGNLRHIRPTKRRKLNGEFDGEREPYTIKRYGKRFNIWGYVRGRYSSYYNRSDVNHHQIAYNHPAIFPEELAEDHIRSWSNEGDLVLDPLCGSGTTCLIAHRLNRKWIGIEINPEYVQLAKKRLTPYIEQQRLDQFVDAEANHNRVRIPSLS